MRKIVINGFKWTVYFVDISKLPEQSDGITMYNERKILVRKDLDKETTKCVLRHEITHAVLCTQGRWSQKTFKQEEMCEFIAFNLDLINKLVEKASR